MLHKNDIEGTQERIPSYYISIHTKHVKITNKEEIVT